LSDAAGKLENWESEKLTSRPVGPNGNRRKLQRPDKCLGYFLDTLREGQRAWAGDFEQFVTVTGFG